MDDDLTKYALPLIIVLVLSVGFTLGGGYTSHSRRRVGRGYGMRVSVYKIEGGTWTVLVEASPGKGRAPVLLKGITPGNVVASVLPVVEAMRRPKGEEAHQLP